MKKHEIFIIGFVFFSPIKYRFIPLLLVSFFIGQSLVFSQDTRWLTYYEKSGYKDTPRYDSTISYCTRLAGASPWVRFTTFGTSPQGRQLPLLILDRNRHFTPSEVRKSGNLILLIQAGIHAGEIDGKDAGLMFFRDVAILKKYPELLDHVTILFIPIFNVDGHERFGPYNRINQVGPEEMGWRTTAQNLNLNRDYLKADAPEMQAWLNLFNQWLPDFFMDIHVTDGADYEYVSTYGLETLGNLDDSLTSWTENKLIPVMEQKMENAGYPVFSYVSFRRWGDPHSGLRDGPASPRFSTGYAAVRNRIGLLVENHMLKDYHTRVSASYEWIRVICGILNDQSKTLKDLNLAADGYASSEDFRKKEFPVSFAPTNDSTMVEFRGVEYDEVHSDLTGGIWFQYHPDRPKTYLIPQFDTQKPSVFASLPEAYIIPPEWTSVIERLKWHGIEYTTIKKDVDIPVSSYIFHDPSWARSPYEGRFPLDVKYDSVELTENFPAGSVVVPMNQSTSRIIANLLEPGAPDSFVSWGFFNTIFEQKEYAETYVMEKVAREMIEKDPSLKAEFEKKKAEDPQFAKDQWTMLNWFFLRSPYRDLKINMYPVGKIYDKKALAEILK
jgi:hypothetical protein